MSTDTREALAALMVIAAECAQRKPLRGFEELTEAIHIGHRQFGRAHEKADEDVRMLAVRLRAVFDTLAAALATQPAQPSVELSVRAVEELLQLGYTVKDDLLYPPTEEQMPKELLDGGVDPAVIADYKHWVATRPSNWRELSAAQPSAHGEAVADKYGSTDFGYTFAGIPVSDGGKRLMSMLVRAFGTDHPAVNDLTALLFSAASAPAAPAQAVPLTDEQIDSLRGLDTASRVRFYEHDFFVLSNFSAFTLVWKGIRFDTSEAAYHWEKFTGDSGSAQLTRHFIQTAPSAHAAFKVAEMNKPHRRADWDDVKVGIMLDILRAKAAQHEYVRRKLLATGDRELVEDSWRDDFWGWGPNRAGRNMLGKLWMRVRSELRGIAPKAAQEPRHG